MPGGLAAEPRAFTLPDKTAMIENGCGLALDGWCVGVWHCQPMRCDKCV